jgi:hypothetical protein
LSETHSRASTPHPLPAAVPCTATDVAAPRVACDPAPSTAAHGINIATLNELVTDSAARARAQMLQAAAGVVGSTYPPTGNALSIALPQRQSLPPPEVLLDGLTAAELRVQEAAELRAQEAIKRAEQAEQASLMWRATREERELLGRMLHEGALPPAILSARITLAAIDFGRTLGQGSFGAVSVARWGERSVAVKRLHRNCLDERTLNAVLRGTELSLTLPEHINVLRLFGIAWSIDLACVVLVMQLVSGGTLGSALTRADPLDWTAQKVPIIQGIARGLSFLHQQSPPIIHRDLKPENVLLDVDDGRCISKVGDLDTLRIDRRSSRSMMTGEVGTPVFGAPELHRRDLGFDRDRKAYGAPVDVWSLCAAAPCLRTWLCASPAQTRRAALRAVAASSRACILTRPRRTREKRWRR